mgnify:CR=1 FL=1
MKTTTYAKLSKFVGKQVNNLDYCVTEFTEERIIEYATNKIIAYRIIQTNDTEAKDIKILNNLRGEIKNISYPDLNRIFDANFENKGNYDDISRLLKDFMLANSMSKKDFIFMIDDKEFLLNTKNVKPALDFVKTLMNDKTEISFNDDNLKLEYNSVFKPLRFTFLCLNDLTVQILITPMRNIKRRNKWHHKSKNYLS